MARPIPAARRTARLPSWSCLAAALVGCVALPAAAQDDYWTSGGLPPAGRWAAFPPDISPGFAAAARSDGGTGTATLNCASSADLQGLGLGLTFEVADGVDPTTGRFFVRVGDLDYPAGDDHEVFEGGMVALGVPAFEGGYPNPYWPGQVALLRALGSEAPITVLLSPDGDPATALPVWSIDTGDAEGLTSVRETCGDLSALADLEPVGAPVAPLAPAAGRAGGWRFVPSSLPAIPDQARFAAGDLFGLSFHCDARHDGIGYQVGFDIMQAAGFAWGDTLILVVDGVAVEMPLTGTDVGYVSAEGDAYRPWAGGPEALGALMTAGSAALVRVAAADGARTVVLDLTTTATEGLRPVAEGCGALPGAPGADAGGVPSGPPIAPPEVPPGVTLGPTAVPGPGGPSWELVAQTDLWRGLTAIQTDPATGLGFGAACSREGPVFFLRGLQAMPAEARLAILVDDRAAVEVAARGVGPVLFFTAPPELVEGLRLGANAAVGGPVTGEPVFHLRGSARAIDTALGPCTDIVAGGGDAARDALIARVLDFAGEACRSFGSDRAALGDGALSIEGDVATVNFAGIRCEGGSPGPPGAGFCGARACLVETYRLTGAGFALEDQTYR